MRHSLARLPPPSAGFYDFGDFERFVQAASKRGPDAYLVVLLGGEAGLRRGEIAALEWSDVDFNKGQLCVRRSVWKGHTQAPKGGRLRYVPLTHRLTAALQAARHVRGPLVFSDAAGKPLNEKIIADHVDLRTTERYMHLSPSALDSAIRLLDAPPLHSSFGDIVETGLGGTI